MVGIGSKSITQRTATVSGRISVPEATYNLAVSHGSPTTAGGGYEMPQEAEEKLRKKGGVIAVPQLDGMLACKRTVELIPLCHQPSITRIDVSLASEVKSDGITTVSCTGKTGVELEVLTAVSVALLNVWDMVKAVGGKEMEI